MYRRHTTRLASSQHKTISEDLQAQIDQAADLIHQLLQKVPEAEAAATAADLYQHEVDVEEIDDARQKADAARDYLRDLHAALRAWNEELKRLEEARNEAEVHETYGIQVDQPARYLTYRAGSSSAWARSLPR